MYCGAEGFVTDDHCPPKGLFAKPRPTLITVPACDECNRGFSRDDEYFRDFFVMDERSRGNQDRDALVALINRSYTRPQSAKMQAALARETRARIRERPNSDVLTIGRLRHASGMRLSVTAARIAKGLFWYHKGFRLPKDYDAFAAPLHILPTMDRTVPGSGSYALEIAEMLRLMEPYKVGHAFEYCWMTSPNGVAVTYWLLSVYGNECFLVQTFPKTPTREPPNSLIRLDQLQLDEHLPAQPPNRA